MTRRNSRYIEERDRMEWECIVPDTLNDQQDRNESWIDE